MLKQNKGKLVASSLVILLPMLAGLLLWNRLPDIMTSHWAPGGQADGWAGRGFVVFGLPLILLALHWLGMLLTSRDPGHKDLSKKALGMVFWIVPVISVVCCGFVYAVALGWELSTSSAIPVLLLGFMFIVIGNYLPKCRQNYTLGIKIKWTLENEENWNATHRFGGRVWVICGIAVLPGLLLPGMAPFALIMAVTAVAVILPTVYSYRYHKRQVREGTASVSQVSVAPKWAKWFTAIVLVPVLLLLTVLFFTGSIRVEYGETAFTVDSTYSAPITVAYDSIEAVEFREKVPTGVKTYGFNSPRLLLGTYQNDEFGTYSRYTRTGSSCVVLTVEGKALVLSGADEAATRELYDTLLSRISSTGEVTVP